MLAPHLGPTWWFGSCVLLLSEISPGFAQQPDWTTADLYLTSATVNKWNPTQPPDNMYLFDWDFTSTAVSSVNIAASQWTKVGSYNEYPFADGYSTTWTLSSPIHLGTIAVAASSDGRDQGAHWYVTVIFSRGAYPGNGGVDYCGGFNLHIPLYSGVYKDNENFYYDTSSSGITYHNGLEISNGVSTSFHLRFIEVSLLPDPPTSLYVQTLTADATQVSVFSLSLVISSFSGWKVLTGVMLYITESGLLAKCSNVGNYWVAMADTAPGNHKVPIDQAYTFDPECEYTIEVAVGTGSENSAKSTPLVLDFAGAPSSLTVGATGPESVSLSWMDGSPGSTSLAKFRITYQQTTENGAAVATSPVEVEESYYVSMPYKLQGLKPVSDYTVTIQVRNSWLYSPTAAFGAIVTTTPFPTVNPTINPTINPTTTNPSTINPTTNPSTANPTTANPTTNPSTTNPTSNPSTSNPTLNPTHHSFFFCNNGGGCGEGDCDLTTLLCVCPYPLAGNRCQINVKPKITGISSIQGVSSAGDALITLRGIRLAEFDGGQATFGGEVVPFTEGPQVENIVPEEFSTGKNWIVISSIVITLPQAPVGYVLLEFETPVAGRRRLAAASAVLRFPVFVFYDCPSGHKSSLVSTAPDVWKCEPCPEGGYCPGGDRVWPRLGYWSKSEQDDPEECESDFICPGLSEEQIIYLLNEISLAADLGTIDSFVVQTAACSDERQGIMCAECAEGFYEDANVCRPCSEAGEGKPSEGLMLAAAAVACTLFMLAFGIVTFTSVGLKEITEWTLLLQDLSFAAAVGSNGLPEDQTTLIKIFSIMSIFNFEFRAAEPGCQFPAITLLDELYATVTISFVFVLLCCCMSFLHGLVMKLRYKKYLKFLQRRAEQRRKDKEIKDTKEALLEKRDGPREKTEQKPKKLNGRRAAYWSSASVSKSKSNNQVIEIRKSSLTLDFSPRKSTKVRHTLASLPPDSARERKIVSFVPERLQPGSEALVAIPGSTDAAARIMKRQERQTRRSVVIEQELSSSDAENEETEGPVKRTKRVEWEETLPPETFWLTVKRRAYHSILLIGTIMHLQITVLSLKTLICEEMSMDGELAVNRVVEDPRFECYSGKHVYAAGLAWILLICVGFAFPVYVFLTIRREFKVKHPHLLQKQSLGQFAFPRNQRQKLAASIHWKYDFLFEGLQPKFYWISVMPFFVNYLMITTEMLADSDQVFAEHTHHVTDLHACPLQIQVACFMMGVDFFLEYLVVAILLPKEDEETNVDDLKTLSTKKLTVAFVFMALSVWIQGQPDDESVGGDEGGEGGEELQPSEDPLYLGLFWALTAMYTVTLAYLMYMYRLYWAGVAKAILRSFYKVEDLLLSLVYFLTCKAKRGLACWGRRIYKRKQALKAEREEEIEQLQQVIKEKLKNQENVNEELEEIEQIEEDDIQEEATQTEAITEVVEEVAEEVRKEEKKELEKLVKEVEEIENKRTKGSATKPKPKESEDELEKEQAKVAEAKAKEEARLRAEEERRVKAAQEAERARLQKRSSVLAELDQLANGCAAARGANGTAEALQKVAYTMFLLVQAVATSLSLHSNSQKLEEARRVLAPFEKNEKANLESAQVVLDLNKQEREPKTDRPPTEAEKEKSRLLERSASLRHLSQLGEAYDAAKGSQGTREALVEKLKQVEETMGPFQDDERAAIEAAKSVLKKTYESGKEEAMKSLQALSKADIATLKSYSKPPADVLSTMLGIYLLLGHAKDDVDEWPEIKNQLKLMGKKATLYRLSQRNVMDISDKAAKLAKKHLARITSAEDLGKKAKAAKAFYLWAIDALKQRDQLKSKDMTTTA